MVLLVSLTHLLALFYVSILMYRCQYLGKHTQTPNDGVIATFKKSYGIFIIAV